TLARPIDGAGPYTTGAESLLIGHQRGLRDSLAAVHLRQAGLEQAVSVGAEIRDQELIERLVLLLFVQSHRARSHQLVQAIALCQPPGLTIDDRILDPIPEDYDRGVLELLGSERSDHRVPLFGR